MFLSSSTDLHISASVIGNVEIGFVFDFDKSLCDEGLIHSLNNLEIHNFIGIGMLASHEAVLSPRVTLVSRKVEILVEYRGGLLSKSGWGRKHGQKQEAEPTDAITRK